MFSAIGISELKQGDGLLQLAPGTCLFDPQEADETDGAALLKRHPKHNHIILRPQPSNSGLDPLNWSRWRKELLFLILLVASTLVGVIGPALVPLFSTVSTDLNEPIAKIAQLNGVLVLFEGVGGIILTVTSAFWGRRSSYIFCALCSFFSCIWAALAPTYDILYGARIVQGLGMSAAAVLLGGTITDMFFVHEHGVRIALWQVTYSACIQVAPILSGIIGTNYGWRAIFWVLSAFEGVVLVAVILFTPETKTNLRHESNQEVVDEKSTMSFTEEGETESSTVNDELTFIASLKVFGRFNTDSALITITRPFAVFFTPHIFYATIAYSLSFAWFVITGATYGQIYGGQYYNVSVQSVGYIAGIPPLIGSVLACALSGPLTDWSARLLSQRNHGMFEPEFRLIVMLPASISIAIGGFSWAYTTDSAHSLLIGASLGGGFVFFGATLGLCGTVGYANACYPAQGGDTFAVMMLVRSSFIFGLTYVLNDWLAENGVVQFFDVLTGITLVVYSLSLPVYVYGKRMRSWSARSKILGWAC